MENEQEVKCWCGTGPPREKRSNVTCGNCKQPTLVEYDIHDADRCYTSDPYCDFCGIG